MRKRGDHCFVKSVWYDLVGDRLSNWEGEGGIDPLPQFSISKGTEISSPQKGSLEKPEGGVGWWEVSELHPEAKRSVTVPSWWAFGTSRNTPYTNAHLGQYHLLKRASMVAPDP